MIALPISSFRAAKLLADQETQGFLVWKNGHVLARKYALGALRQCHFNNGIVLVCAKEYPDGRILFRHLHHSVVVVHVHLHLTDVLMRQFANLQVKENETAQKPIVEYEINPKVMFVECDTHLTTDKCETLAKFKKEFAEMIY